MKRVIWAVLVSLIFLAFATNNASSQDEDVDLRVSVAFQVDGSEVKTLGTIIGLDVVATVEVPEWTAVTVLAPDGRELTATPINASPGVGTFLLDVDELSSPIGYRTAIVGNPDVVVDAAFIIGDANSLIRVSDDLTPELQDELAGAGVVNACGEFIGTMNSGKGLEGLNTQSLVVALLAANKDYLTGPSACGEDADRPAEGIVIDRLSAQDIADKDQTIRATKRLVGKLEEQNQRIERTLAEKQEQLQSIEQEILETTQESELQQQSLAKQISELEEQRGLLDQRKTEAEAEIRLLEDDIEQARAQFWVWVLVGILVLLVVAGIFLIALRSSLRRRKQVENERNAYAELVRRIKSGKDIILHGEHQRLKIPGTVIAHTGAIIGRSGSEADVLIDDPRVSRSHAVFLVEDIGLAVRDDSLNGTFINGARIKKGKTKPLAEGDRVRFANTEFTIQTQ
ncbi:MAG: hypothetical protein Hens2KO_27860 [Henriciella sp.]